MNRKPIEILLIEDNPGDARLIGEMLVETRSALFELKWADRLSSGLEYLEAGGFDVVLLDLSLPDSFGLNTLAKVHAQAPQVPIVVLSGLDDEEMAIKAVRKGAQDYLVKGHVDGNLLERAVHYAIERKQTEEALRASRRKIEGLHEIARDLESCRNEDEVYELTVKAAERILSLTMCSLDIAEGNKLFVKATSSGLPSGASVETDLDETSLAGKTYQTGKAILFHKLDEVPEARPTREDFRSGISAPIGDIGVFQAVSMEQNAFSEEDLKLLELLLGHTVEAVRRIRLQDELRDQATRDPLTGVYNRRYFIETIERELERSRRYERPIGFLMIDVDRFKKINDTHGHQTGDRVLQEMADFLRKHVRAAEMVVRYGGDEFLIVMPELEEGTDIVKQRLIEALARWNKTSKIFGFPVGLSIGGATWDPGGSESVEEALARADKQMYEDKRKRAISDRSAEQFHGARSIRG